MYRLFSFLGGVLIPLFGFLRDVTAMEATDPIWLRIGIAGICFTVLGASYGWKSDLEKISHWMRAVVYVILTWIVVVAVMNGFSGGYSVGVLTVFIVLATGLGFEAKRGQPVLWFSAFGFLAVGVGLIFSPSFHVPPLILMSSLATIAVVECVVVQGWSSVQRLLQKERDRFVTLFHNLPTPIVNGYPDEKGRIRIHEVNESFETIFGYEKAEVRGEDLQELLVPVDDRPEAETLRRRLISGDTIRHEVQRKTTEGLRDFQIQVALRKGESWPTEGFAIYTDITDRKNRERTLAQRTALLEAQAESSLDGLLVVDRNWDIAFHNDRFLEIWNVSIERVANPPSGQSKEQILLESILKLAPSSSELQETVEYLRDNPSEKSRNRFQLTDGRWIDRYSSPIVGDNGTHFGRLWVFRDVTEQRRMQERLLEVQAEERRRINQEIQGEIGGLLASIQMKIDLARNQIQEKDAVTDHFDQIEALVSELATGARTISRKLYPGALSDYGLAGTLPSLVDEMEKQHDLIVDLQSDVEPEDRFSSLVERTAYWIIQEALVNVVRHAETIAATVVVLNEEERLSLHITDEGVGFASTKQDGEESFGLEGIRRRVERLEGDIRIDSVPGEGTRISVRLPLPTSSQSKRHPVPGSGSRDREYGWKEGGTAGSGGGDPSWNSCV